MREFAESLSKEYEIIHDARLIDWLATNRIELNSILATVEPEVFSRWLRWKISQVWQKRDYRRAVFIDEDNIISPTMQEFHEWYARKREPIIKVSLEKAKDELSDVKGFIENTDDKGDEIETDIVDNSLLKHYQIKKIDLALKRIMKKYD
jgi:hypothetical protein